VYFIKTIVVINIQARNHLAQAQRINEEEKLNKRGNLRSGNYQQATKPRSRARRISLTTRDIQRDHQEHP
jgi:hypothetical protein